MTSKISSKTIMKKPNVLILGNGYIGNYVFNFLNKNNFNVIKKSSQELNYHDKGELYRFILNNDFQFVVNCSGFTGRPNIDEAELKKELCWELNVLSPLRVSHVCNLLGIGYIHISSGCIYDGYEKEWEEDDNPNFGLFSNNSSFYSKSKHAFEVLSEELRGVILRIRMPFGPDSSHRNYLTKIRNYNNLINFKNSKTYIPDLCGFILNILEKDDTRFWSKKQIFNVVNPSPLWTNEVCDIMKDYGFHNMKWEYVTLDSLNIATGRSNCTTNNDKASEIYNFKTEREALKEYFETILKEKERYNNTINQIEEKYKTL